MKRLILFLVLAAAIHTAAAQNPVEPQPPRPDGSLVHVVQFGDTLDTILIAYAKYNVTIEDLIVYNGWRFRPQFIFVGDEIIILPPGALDPDTGELIPGFQPPVQPEATAAGESPAATPTSPPAAEVTPTSLPDNLPAEPSVPAFQGITPFLPVGNAPVESTPESAAVMEAVQPESTEDVATAETTPESVEATEAVQPESTEEVAAVPTLESTPESAEVMETVQPEATEETVPMEIAANVPDFTAAAGFICVRFFDDGNQNGRRETDESLLTGGQVTIGENSQTGVEEAVCFENVPPGENHVTAVAPEGYGLTTSPVLLVQVVAGETSEVFFGAAADYTPPDTPVPAQETLSAPLPESMQNVQNTQVEDTFRLEDYSAYLVLAVAAAVLVGGGIIIAALRSFH